MTKPTVSHSESSFGMFNFCWDGIYPRDKFVALQCWQHKPFITFSFVFILLYDQSRSLCTVIKLLDKAVSYQEAEIL